MIRYRLDDLGWWQFEQLCQALMKAHLGIAIEAWGGNADIGRDCYCERPVELVKGIQSQAPLVFQAKFVAEANSAGARSEQALIRAIRAECDRMRQRTEKRQVDTIREYILLTNAPVSPTLELSIKEMISIAAPNSQISIQRGSDICGLIDLNPRLRTSYPQLLGVADLQELSAEAVRRAVNKTIVERSAISLELAHELSRVFVSTSIYESALSVLRKHNFVVLTGPPEMGKTTIARVLALAAYTIGFEYYECRSPQDFLQIIERNKDDKDGQSRQIFVVDDAFGSTEYDPSLASAWARDLEHILHCLDNKHRLIWTSRSAPLARALERLNIDSGNDQFPKPIEVFVSANALSDEEKALILYRHAKHAGLDTVSKKLIKDNAVRIVRDEHFTPERIRRFITSALPELVKGASGLFGKLSLQSRLEKEIRDPTKRMRTSFNVLNTEQRQFLIAMLDCESGPVPELILDSARSRLFASTKNTSTKLIARELDGHFILSSESDRETIYSWVHPSWRDLMIEYLSTHTLDRHNFLAHCTVPGIMLSLSTAGGRLGERQTPLLQEGEDTNKLLATFQRVILAANYKVLETLTATLCQASTEAARPEDKAQRARMNSFLKNTLAIVSSAIDANSDGVTKEFLGNSYRLAQLLNVKPNFRPDATWEYYRKELKNSLNKNYMDSVRSDFYDLVHLARTLEKNDPNYLIRIGYPESLIDLYTEVLAVLDNEIDSTTDEIDDLDEDESSEKNGEFADWEAAVKLLAENAPSNLASEVETTSRRISSLSEDLSTREEEAQREKERAKEEDDDDEDDEEILEVPAEKEGDQKLMPPTEPKTPLSIELLFSDL